MIQQIGVLLLEKDEIIIRVYEVNNLEWRLLHYQSMQSQTLLQAHDLDAETAIETIAEFLISEPAQHIDEWKVCSRGLSSTDVQTISSAIGLNIEILTPLREQELLCKGMFTELW